MKMLRRGRFGRKMDPLASEYTSSMPEDVRIFDSVVSINLAHVLMLQKRKIIEKRASKKILKALLALQRGGVRRVELKPELEDVHMAIEKYVIDKVGEKIGGKLHAAKSRNDQVAAAIRMTLRRDILDIQKEILNLAKELLKLASQNSKTIMPGYTHLQVAQPTTFAHYLLAYAQRFLRDAERLSQVYERVNLSPMGACALAGTGFPIDRSYVAKLLGFDGLVENTMDAVGSRDFALEAMSALAILMCGIGRMAEEISLWSSSEFDMIEIPEEFASTSSIMPQKKNPVVAEIARANAGRVLGELSGGISLMKSLPQSYSLDLQELTPMLWNAVDRTKSTLRVMSKLVRGIKPKPEVMFGRVESGYATATDLADTLVQVADLPFRDAHAVVGRMIANALREGKPLGKLSLEDLKASSREIVGREVKISEEEFKKALNPEESVRSRTLPGGPAPKSVKRQIDRTRKAVENLKKTVASREKALSEAEKNLRRKVEEEFE